MTQTMAVEDLYRASHSRLVALAWMILGSREVAEDAVQEAFARLAARPDGSVREPGAYIRRVVVNECRAVIRRRGRLELRDAVDVLVHHDPEVGELADLLDRLSPRRRMAVLLRFHCDLPVTEIAAIMECRPSTVSSLLHRALSDLQGALR